MVETYEAAPYEPASPAEAAILAMALVLEGREGDRMQRLLGKVQKELPDEAEILRALQLCRKDDAMAAEDCLVGVFQRMRANPWIMTPIGSAAVRAAVPLACRVPRAGLAAAGGAGGTVSGRDPSRGPLPRLLALGKLAGTVYACEDLQRFEPNVPWEADFLRASQLYADLGDARAGHAARDQDELLKNAAAQRTAQ